MIPLALLAALAAAALPPLVCPPGTERRGATPPEGYEEWCEILERHRDGEKAREGTFSRGARHGRWSVWWSSGRLEEEAEWREGVLHGRFVAYWSTGKRRTEGRHCGGAQCGTWRTFDDAGRELGAVEYGEQRLDP